MKYAFVSAVSLAMCIAVYAHTNEEIEQELIRLHDRVETYSSYSTEYSEDREEKLAVANQAFRDAILTLTSQHPSTLLYKFPSLSDRIQIETSPDQNLRVYSWDTLSGGTMHFYDNVYQFRSVEGVFATGSFYEEGDPGSFVTKIHSVKTKTGIVYLVCTTSVLSTSYRGQSIAAFQIDGNKLSAKVKIFKTDSGLTNSIGFAYDFFTVADREERPIQLFEYEPKSKILSFPVVLEDDKTPQGRVTDSRIVYRFDGDYFVRAKK